MPGSLMVAKIDYKPKKTQNCRKYILSGPHVLERGYGDVPRSSWPILSDQSALLSLPICHQRAAHVPPFAILEKIAFSTLFLIKLLRRQNVRIFAPKTWFFKENPLPIPYFCPHAAHTPQKKLSAPPPSGIFVQRTKLCCNRGRELGI